LSVAIADELDHFGRQLRFAATPGEDRDLAPSTHRQPHEMWADVAGPAKDEDVHRRRQGTPGCLVVICESIMQEPRRYYESMLGGGSSEVGRLARFSLPHSENSQ